MSELKKEYFPCDKLYANSDCVMVRLEYSPERGYEIIATPCSHDDMSFSVVFDREYFNTFKEISNNISEAVGGHRKSAKRTETAISLFNNNSREYAERYCECVSEKSGREIRLK